MIKKILIDALNYFWKLFNIVSFFIIVLLFYIIAFIKGRQIGKWIIKLYERFKK